MFAHLQELGTRLCLRMAQLPKLLYCLAAHDRARGSPRHATVHGRRTDPQAELGRQRERVMFNTPR